MTLLITVYAAVIVTVLWYNRKDDSMRLGMLCFLFWGASIMWFVDAIFEYVRKPVYDYNEFYDRIMTMSDKADEYYS